MHRTRLKPSLPPANSRWFTLVTLLTSLMVISPAQAGSVTRTVAYEYDMTKGYVTAEVREPDNPQLSLRTAYTYNQFGSKLTTAVSSPATGQAAITARTVSSITYDENGIRPLTSTNALGQVLNLEYDTNSQLTSVLNLNGLYTTYSYDGFRRKSAEHRPDGTKTEWSYQHCDTVQGCPANAKFVVTTTPKATDGSINGAWVKTYHDSFERPVRTETQGFDGVTVITQDTEYDALGRVARTSKPYYPSQTKQWTTYTYDVLGRTVATTAPDGAQVSIAYNGLSTVTTNALSQTQSTVSNGRGQTVQVTDTQGNVLAYQYDAQGNLTKTTDPKGNVVTMVYDLLSRKTSMIDPDLGTVSFVYNALGELIQRTDAKSNVTTYGYDVMSRMTRRTEVDLVSNWVYDTCSKGKGRLCRATADNGFSADYSFDGQSRPSQTVSQIEASYTMGNTYDVNGRLATQTYPTGLAVKYVYTSLGYLSEVRNNATNALYWKADARDAEGHLTQQTYGNNVVTQQVFDPATGRIKNIYAGAGNAVQNLSFTFDKRGNMLTRSDANQNLNETFLYDTLNRLTSNTVNSSGAGLVTQTYGYDSIGNITSRSDMGAYTYGAVNNKPHAVAQIALAGGGTRQYIYDGSGNLTQEVQRDAANNVIAAKGRTSTYTSFDMPVTLVNPAATLTFTYGPEHQRIKQVSPSATTIYVHPDNVGGLAYEKDIKVGGVVEHKHYITAGDGVVAMVKQGPSGTSTVYFHRDHLGSTTVTTNESGAVLERFAYEPFGKRRTPAGALDPNGALVGVTTDRGFTNHEELDELGLIHMNGRVYDPATGRFMSADPNVPYPTNIQSYNRYSYSRNNPLVFIDPSGFREYFIPFYSGGEYDYGGGFDSSRMNDYGYVMCMRGGGGVHCNNTDAKVENQAVSVDSGQGISTNLPSFAALENLQADSDFVARIIIPGYGFSQDGYQSFLDKNYLLGSLQYLGAGVEVYAAGRTGGATALAMAALRAKRFYASAKKAADLAASNAMRFTVKSKHLPVEGAKGSWSRFSDGVNPNELIKLALTSENIIFTPNNVEGSFRAVVDLGKTIGTKGETSIRVIFDTAGNIWTAFPVK